MTPPSAVRTVGRPAQAGAVQQDDWVARLSATGPMHDEAVRQLHSLLQRAARHQISQMPDASGLGTARIEEIVHATANEATVSVLRRLDSFEGRSRFTTWAYKFGILQASVEVRRSMWRHREVDLEAIAERASTSASPSEVAEGSELGREVWAAMDRSLTTYQRKIALALLVEGVPVDVLADRLGTNRNALYKTLHIARRRLRADLVDRGFLNDSDRG